MALQEIEDPVGSDEQHDTRQQVGILMYVGLIPGIPDVYLFLLREGVIDACNQAVVVVVGDRGGKVVVLPIDSCVLSRNNTLR